MAAIYQPRPGDIIEITTTPYPVVVVETVVFGVTLTGGYMGVLPSEATTALPPDMHSGYHYQARWFYTDGPYEEATTADPPEMHTGYNYQARWFYTDGPYEEATFADPPTMFNGFYLNKLVSALTGRGSLQPYEELHLGCAVHTSCSMTGV